MLERAPISAAILYGWGKAVLALSVTCEKLAGFSAQAIHQPHRLRITAGLFAQLARSLATGFSTPVFRANNLFRANLYPLSTLPIKTSTNKNTLITYVKERRP